MNITLLFFVKIESKVVSFGIRGSSGEERGSLWSLSYGRVVELRPRPTWSMIVIRGYKKNKLSFSTPYYEWKLLSWKRVTNLWRVHYSTCDKCGVEKFQIDVFYNKYLIYGGREKGKGHFTHEQRAMTMKLREPKRKCPKAVPRHLQIHVVWSWTLKCSVSRIWPGA